MAMLVPLPSRRKNNVAFIHWQLFAVNNSVAAFSFDDNARRRRRVNVVGRRFARQQQLQPKINGRRRLHRTRTTAWIRHYQHASFGLFNRRELARLHEQRP